MVSRLKLQPAPTFKATVQIPVPGGKDEPVEFVFKFRNRDEIKKLIDGVDGQLWTDVILAVAENWDLSDPFTRESIDLLTTNYVGAGQAIFDTYVEQHTKARAKN